jgi:hypothetical protein
VQRKYGLFFFIVLEQGDPSLSGSMIPDLPFLWHFWYKNYKNIVKT